MTRAKIVRRIYLDLPALQRPAERAKHLIGITPKRNGFFVVNNRRMVLDRKAFREIVAEGRQAGCEGPWFIYGVFPDHGRRWRMSYRPTITLSFPYVLDSKAECDEVSAYIVQDVHDALLWALSADEERFKRPNPVGELLYGLSAMIGKGGSSTQPSI